MHKSKNLEDPIHDKNFPTKKTADPNGFPSKFYKKFKKEI